MCGRIALYTPPFRLARLLEAALAAGIEPDGKPSWNVPPQETLFGVSSREGHRVLDAYRWGLVPSWVDDPSVGNRMFNARSETVTTKPSYRNAFERHRLLVPVDGFYEWDRRDGGKVPHYFSRADGEPLVLAGLYEFWRNRETPDAPWLRTCTVLTTTPGRDMDDIHDRMPVVLERDAFETWLTAADDEHDALVALCAPARTGTLVHHPVGPQVGNVNNNGPELIDEVAAPRSMQPQLGDIF